MTNSKHFSDTNCTVCTLLVVIMAEAKIDLILEQLKALGPIQFALEGLRSSIQDVNEDVKNLQFDTANHDDRIRALERDMKEQKDIPIIPQLPAATSQVSYSAPYEFPCQP